MVLAVTHQGEHKGCSVRRGVWVHLLMKLGLQISQKQLPLWTVCFKRTFPMVCPYKDVWFRVRVKLAGQEALTTVLSSKAYGGLGLLIRVVSRSLFVSTNSKNKRSPESSSSYTMYNAKGQVLLLCTSLGPDVPVAEPGCQDHPK